MSDVYYQQGDLLLFVVDSLPSGAEPLTSDVLLAGERTGHAHRLDGDCGKLWRDGNGRYLQATQELAVRHEEHLTLRVPPGFYRVARVRAVDHFPAEPPPPPLTDQRSMFGRSQPREDWWQYGSD